MLALHSEARKKRSDWISMPEDTTPR